MTQRITQSGLQVPASLHELLAHRIWPGTGHAPEAIWAALEKIVADLAPRVRTLPVAP